ncbi:hypothetical protein EVAR_12621_1 [Eumeta japonica]|uniref:Uncharacterized protein n=1 Tax=Eumeta variegata TaxID=151549 RepID=A0A4C1UGA8_EUMVA|nr:hypothetical protein EVAR_12621_1 [Eumeta japonica]
MGRIKIIRIQNKIEIDDDYSIDDDRSEKEYDFKSVNTSEGLNVVPDFLSRNPLEESKEVKTVENEIELAVYMISAEKQTEKKRYDEFCRCNLEALAQSRLKLIMASYISSISVESMTIEFGGELDKSMAFPAVSLELNSSLDAKE